jgi:trk system potassium uptake protein TrkH
MFTTLNIGVVLFLIGILESIMAVIMLVPLGLELFFYETTHWHAFAESAFMAGFLGSILSLAFRPHGSIVLHVREAFLLTALVWVVTSLVAALPIYLSESWSGQTLSFIDACFEAVSGLTTTGGTTLIALDDAPRGLLLWRAMLQWIGGIGIIVMALSILPILRIGGMQLFRSESSDRSEKILPRLQQIASEIFKAYLALTFICTAALLLLGLSLFDAFCHSMSAVSTGGFSTHDASIAAFNSVGVEIVLIIFMTLGGSSLVLLVQSLRGQSSALFRDPQHRTYLFILALLIGILTLWRFLYDGVALLTSLRHVGFSVVSVMTTTGFIAQDYTLWGPFPVAIFLVLGSIGGCTGSTAGGIKIFRFQALFALAGSHLRQLRRPHGVYLATYNGQKISDTVALSVFTFVTLYLLALVLIALGLSAFGLDLVTSISGAATSLGNVGPGLGSLIGPDGNFASLSVCPKLLLMFAMILGRLELMTIIVLLMPSFWRD